MLRSITLLLCLLVGSSVNVARADQASEVRATLQQLFDGMRAGDAASVQQVFHPEARFLSVGEKEGAPFLFHGDPAAFVQAIGKPHEQVWDERVWEVEIRVDGSLATAWMQYAFFLDDTLSHCGVNAFQLFHASARWQIIQITDTRQHDGCVVPADTE